MKLTLLGAGVRTPLLLNGLLRRAAALPLAEVVLYDTDQERLAVMGELGAHFCRERGARFQVRAETDPEEALRGARFVFTALRVGQERSRVVDERVPLSYGLVGQETTGAGGFAMALRTIPVMLDYARLIERVAPGAWVVNFTNPAGLITQALRDNTDVRVVGICDTPTAMKRSLAEFLGAPPEAVGLDYFGLNHLGWVRGVMVEGRDRTPELLERYEELRAADREWRLFDADLVRGLGLLPNEYLYYFYYRERAVARIRAAPRTRGQELATLNARLWPGLRARLDEGDFAGALALYEETMAGRHAGYMATEGGLEAGAEPVGDDALFEQEGYEGLAMSVMTSVIEGRSDPLIVNLPSRGSLGGRNDDDVVEVPSMVRDGDLVPLAGDPPPAEAGALIGAVKTYERLTAEAAVTGSFSTAVRALTVHPLVASYSLATSVVRDYLAALAPYLPQFGNGVDRRKREVS